MTALRFPLASDGSKGYPSLPIFRRVLKKICHEAHHHIIQLSPISEIHVYPDQKPSGQWIESIGFRLPIIENSFEMSLDKLNGLETVMQFTLAE